VIFAIDAQGIYTFCEGRPMRSGDLAAERIVGHSIEERFRDRPEVLDCMRRGLAGETLQFVTRFLGHVFQNEVTPHYDGEGNVAGLVGFSYDITERTRVEESLRKSQELLAEAQQVARIGSWDFDVATSKITWSEQMFRLAEVDPARGEPSLKALIANYHPDDGAALLASIRRALATGEPYAIDLRRLKPDMSICWMHAIGHTETNPDGVVTRLFGTCMDITERKAAQDTIHTYSIALEEKMAELERVNRELAALATTDGLTSLLNHRAFYDRLEDELREAQRYGSQLSLLMIDVDNFKRFNDDFGHPAGDEVLKQVAAVVAASGRRIDIVARYGGEELAVILPQTGRTGALIAAERIRLRIQQREWRDRPITVSIGIATVSPETERPLDLVVAADRALYESKAAGRNCVRHSEPD